MKIKYKKIICSTGKETSLVLKHIIESLESAEYRINLIGQNTIAFEYNIMRLDSNIKIFDKVDGGVFEVSSDEHGSILTFSYYISITYEVFVLLAITSFSIYFDYRIIFLGLFLLILFLIRMALAKLNAKNLMERALAVQRPKY